MPHAPGNVRESEGINPHTPKGTPILGWNLGGLPNFQSAITRVKTHCIEKFFISLKNYSNVDV
jgi:hypothetical protein